MLADAAALQPVLDDPIVRTAMSWPGEHTDAESWINTQLSMAAGYRVASEQDPVAREGRTRRCRGVTGAPPPKLSSSPSSSSRSMRAGAAGVVTSWRLTWSKMAIPDRPSPGGPRRRGARTPRRCPVGDLGCEVDVVGMKVGEHQPPQVSWVIAERAAGAATLRC